MLQIFWTCHNYAVLLRYFGHAYTYLYYHFLSVFSRGLREVCQRFVRGLQELVRIALRINFTFIHRRLLYSIATAMTLHYQKSLATPRTTSRSCWHTTSSTPVYKDLFMDGDYEWPNANDAAESGEAVSSLV